MVCLSEFVGEDGCYRLGVSGFERFNNGRVFKCETRVYAVLKAQGEEFVFGHSHISNKNAARWRRLTKKRTPAKPHACTG